MKAPFAIKYAPFKLASEFVGIKVRSLKKMKNVKMLTGRLAD